MIDRFNILSVLGHLTWIIGLFGVIGLSLSAVDKKKSERIQSIDIEVHPLKKGEDLLQAGDVYSLLKSKLAYPLVGLPLEEVDLAKIEQIVRSHSFIRSADGYLNARSILQIEVKQREAVLRIIPVNNASYYLDKNGHTMPLSTAFTPRVPVVFGAVPDGDESNWSEVENERMNTVLNIRNVLAKDEFLSAWLDQIIVHSGDTYSLYSALTDQYLDLGKANRLSEKFENVQIFCEEVIPETGWKKYARIDARYHHQIVGEKRQ